MGFVGRTLEGNKKGGKEVLPPTQYLCQAFTGQKQRMISKKVVLGHWSTLIGDGMPSMRT
jgi:hypothetical protein